MKTTKTINQHIQKAIVKLALLATITMIMAFSCLEENITSTEPEPELITTLTGFDASAKQLPESIAIDHHGNIYLSMSPLHEIWKIDPDGHFTEVVANFSLEPGFFGVSGLDFDPRGNLYVAISSTDTTMNGIWKISSSGERERIAGTGKILLANDLTVMPNGTIYITDSAMGSVWRYKPGEQTKVWIQDASHEGTGAFGLGVPIGANGIVYIPEGKAGVTGALIIANTEKGQMVSIPVLPDGDAGKPEVLIADPSGLFGLDGITSDALGNIYAAVNGGNKIVRISADGSDLTELSSGAPLDFPTSLAFGAGKDRHTLFISNFSVIHFLHNPPTLENANPGVVMLSVEP